MERTIQVIAAVAMMALAGCANAPIQSWLPDVSYGLLSHWNTDAPDNDPMGKLNSIQERAAGIDSTERFHRGY